MIVEKSYTARIWIHPKKNGHIKKINLQEINQFIIDKFIWLTVGDFIGNYKNEKVGIVFLTCETRKDLETAIDIIRNEELVEMTE